jgi:hypothetical protein
LRILGIGNANAFAGIDLDHYLVPVLDCLTHTGRRHADPVFVILDFLGYAYQHNKTTIEAGLKKREVNRAPRTKLVPAILIYWASENAARALSF